MADHKSIATSTPAFGGLPPWMARMRQAAVDSITETDVKEIVQSQVAKAKQGDPAAIKFVFDQLLGGGMKGATFIQNNYGESPDAPLAPNDPPAKQLDKLRSRASAHLPLTGRASDRRLQTFTDDEEKAMRRERPDETEAA